MSILLDIIEQERSSRFTTPEFCDNTVAERGIYLQGLSRLSLRMAVEHVALSCSDVEQILVEVTGESLFLLANKTDIRRFIEFGAETPPRLMEEFLFEKNERTNRVLANLAVASALAFTGVQDAKIQQPAQDPVVMTSLPSEDQPFEDRRWTIDVDNLPQIFQRQPSLSDNYDDIINQDYAYLALTIWAEARGESEAGMRAVGHVIKNRVDSGRTRLFGSGFRGVVLKPHQFTCWSRRDPNYRRMQQVGHLPEGRDKEKWELAQRIAREILTGVSEDPTNNAVYYHTKSIRPNWVPRVRRVAEIGSHIFYTFQ